MSWSFACCWRSLKPHRVSINELQRCCFESIDRARAPTTSCQNAAYSLTVIPRRDACLPSHSAPHEAVQVKGWRWHQVILINGYHNCNSPRLNTSSNSIPPRLTLLSLPRFTNLASKQLSWGFPEVRLTEMSVWLIFCLKWRKTCIEDLVVRFIVLHLSICELSLSTPPFLTTARKNSKACKNIVLFPEISSAIFLLLIRPLPCFWITSPVNTHTVWTPQVRESLQA